MSPAQHFDWNATYALDQVLLCAACEIAVFGWQPSGTSRDQDGHLVRRDLSKGLSTKERVINYFAGTDTLQRSQRDSIIAAAKEKGIDLFSDDLKQKVTDAIKWAQQLDPGMKNSAPYLLRINRLAELERVPLREFGYVVSIVRMYDASHPPITGKSEYVGMIGDALDIRLRITEVTRWIGPASVSAGSTRVLLRVTGRQLTLLPNPNPTVWVDTENLLTFYTKVDDRLVVNMHLAVTGKVGTHRVWNGNRITQLGWVKWTLA